MRLAARVCFSSDVHHTLGMYSPGERDLLVMYHEVEAQFPHGKEVYGRSRESTCV